MPLLKYLLLEYSKRIRKQLINKFKKENPQLEDDMINAYLDRFKEIKSNVDEPDIMKYSWKELEGTVDGYISRKDKKTKGSAIKSKNKDEDEDLLYDKDGILVFKGYSKDKCIKLSSGYSFCIGSETEGRNMYSNYRKKSGGATPYFVFNTNLDKDDRYHVVVIYTFHDKLNVYSLTDAENDHNNEQAFNSFNELMNFFVEEDQFGNVPWDFKPTFLKNILVAEELDIYEMIDKDKLSVQGNTVTYDGNINLAGLDLTEMPDFTTLDE